ncbi:MAG: S41 family peptidase [Eubacteriales bacterium]|nr:S41 family peptidase [Eubacteriales bacterium]
MKAKYFWIGALSSFAVLSIIWMSVSIVSNLTGLIVSMSRESTQAEGKSLRENMDIKWFESKIKDIDDKLNKNYIEEIDKEKMYEEALKGYVNALGDPYTNYMTKEEFEEFQKDLSASYDGIGAPLVRDKQTNALTIISPYKGSPAEKSGIRTGDVIIAVDGEEISSIEVEEIARRIRGEKGTTVVLTIQRKVEERVEVKDISIVRDTIIIPTIEAKMLPDEIGYIAIFGFDEPTGEQFKKEIDHFRQKNIKGLVIDLRGNPGGYLQIAQEIADEIMLNGLVVSVKDKHGNTTEYKATNPAELKVPIAVLVDKGSASASEILAGALKDHNLATVVGTTTFGKGLVQNTMPFLDGSALKITIAKYYTPSGEYIHGKGIDPDIAVELKELSEEDKKNPDKMDNQLQKAWEVVKSQIR